MRLSSSGLMLLAFLPFAAHAQPTDAKAWLEQAASAAHQLNYSGNFVYQRDNRVETSRITHRVDKSGELEKLEALDGPPRVIIRNNDTVLCYLHGKKNLRLERPDSRKFFPHLLPKRLSTLTDFYNVRLGGQERVAGNESQIILLEPKDALRYGHRLWADKSTGLLLKAAMLDDKNQTVDQFAFTQISIGGAIGKEQFESYLTHPNLAQMENIGTPGQAIAESGWQIEQPPPGFGKIIEHKRHMPGRKVLVSHLVYSDGLAAVSVFVEPAGNPKPEEGLASQGAIHVYTRLLGEYRVTALGEVPAATVMQMAKSLTAKNPK